MKTEITIPKLGLTMEEAEIEGWLKEVGDRVGEGEALLEITTDKATVEVESPASGYLRQITAPAGDAVPVGERIGVITDTEDEAFE